MAHYRPLAVQAQLAYDAAINSPCPDWRAVAELFSGDHKALEVLTWKELYEQAEEAIDACEKVANILEAIVLKQ